MSDPGPASAYTQRVLADAADGLPFEDREDFEDARRGLIASGPELVIRNEGGRTVWDMDSYGFVDADTPDTVHPSLWRMAQLNGMHGLFEVVPSGSTKCGAMTSPTSLSWRARRE